LLKSWLSDPTLLEEIEMFILWSDLAPLILASAAVRLQTIVTLLLVRSSIRSAYAWVAGMTTVRLLQGVLFGVVLRASEAQSQPKSPQFFLGALLLVLALLLYVKALRTAMGADDEDAPPPQWIVKASSMSPLTAFGAGAGFMTLSVKFLVFTLGAISAIADAHLGIELAVITFVLFVALAHAVPFAMLALASSSSSRSAAILEGFQAWLERNNRLITIMFGLVFGTWFLLKALTRLGLV
jgi:threonine/homoserine/homoserine lactone efflux protein